MERSLFILPFLTLMSQSASSAAGTVTASLDITATVPSACEVQAAPIAFGIYDGTAQMVPADITVNCNSGLGYQVALDAGLNGDRSLTDAGGNSLPYSLSYGGTRIAWGDAGVGDTFAAGQPLSAEGTGAPQSYTVDGMIAPGIANLPPGDYSDTVTVTVNF